jgi:nuclear pore complex protein Nup210
MRKGLATATHLTAWMIWKHRNGCVFDGDQPSTSRLNDNIHAEAALWAKAGEDGLRVILPTTWDVH